METNHEKYRACHTALRRARARPRRLSTRNEHVDVAQYAAGRDAEVVDVDAAACVAESTDVLHVAWNEFVDVDHRAAEGGQVADRSAVDRLLREQDSNAEQVVKRPGRRAGGRRWTGSPRLTCR